MRARFLVPVMGTAVLVVTALTGCSRSTDAAADYLEVVTTARSVPSTGGSDVDRTFVTPHFSVEHDEVVTGAELDGKTVEKFGLSGSGTLAAPAGKQLVLVTLRNKAGGIYPDDTSVAPTVTVHAGDRSAPIEQWPAGLGGVAVAAAVGADEPVTLQVEDDGQTVVWDLREGTYGDDPVSQAAAVLGSGDSAREDIGGKVAVSGQATVPSGITGIPAAVRTTQVTVDTTNADLGVTPWFAELRWAPAGSIYVYLTGYRVTYRGSGFVTTTVAEPAAAFTLTPAGGTPVASLGSGTATTPLEVDLDGATSVFQVPVGFTAGTFRFQPQATIRGLTTSGTAAEVTWATPPPAATVALDVTA